jgi:hypothetical protein
MEQRRLRLGDIVDDYCPRERRVTNHAVVAMVEEDVKQARCTTCDTEHPYKGGKAPRRRKKDTTGALYKEVLAGLTDGEPQPVQPVLAAPVPAPVPAIDVPAPIHTPSSNGNANGNGSLQTHAHVAAPVAAPPPVVEVEDAPVGVEDGPVHRPLIRATLPRLEGHKEERKATDFTIRQPSGRGGQQFQNARGTDPNRARPRPGQGHSQGQPAGRPQGAGARFAGSRPGQQTRGASSGRPQQGGGGFRGGQPQGRSNGSGNGNGNGAHGGGRKRSR